MQPSTHHSLAGIDLEGLVSALRAAPGCLGAEIGSTNAGRLLLFGWFRDKRAALDWYYHPAHRQAVAAFYAGAGAAASEPLADVPDHSGPLLAVASMLPGGERGPEFSIELYEALTPGLTIGGAFAPAGVGDAVKARQARP